MGWRPLRHEVAIGRAHRAGEQLVAHRPAIDDEILVRGCSAGAAWAGRRSLPRRRPRARRARADASVDELLAEDAAKPRKPMVEEPGRAWLEPQRGAVADGQAEGDLRLGEREPLDHVGDRRGLGALGLHEFEPRGRGVEQVAHLDARARRRSARA